jgi:predicted lipoprotein|tara:strand:- start:156 stop:353 length:198 start_codon:yes stop_codon:yes gene_type:complete
MNDIQKRFVEKATSSEILDVVESLDKASNSGKLVEVVYTAMETIKSNNFITIPLALQIACEDWDI